MANDISEVVMMIQEVAAVREAMNQNLDAILARLQRMLPEERTDPRVPASYEARCKYYKGFLSRT